VYGGTGLAGPLCWLGIDVTNRWCLTPDAVANRRNDLRTSVRCGIGQRTLVEDWFAHVYDPQGWTLLCLPLTYDPARDRGPNALGWRDPRYDPAVPRNPFPERYTEKVLASERRRLGSVGYSARYQQQPTPAEGALFKRAWFESRRFQLVNNDAIACQGRPGVLPLKNCALFVIAEGACLSNGTADATVIPVCAVDPRNGDLFVLWVVRDRLEVEEIIPVIEDVCLFWHPARPRSEDLK
jgi:hypothetical protein